LAHDGVAHYWLDENPTRKQIIIKASGLRSRASGSALTIRRFAILKWGFRFQYGDGVLSVGFSDLELDLVGAEEAMDVSGQAQRVLVAAEALDPGRLEDAAREQELGVGAEACHSDQALVVGMIDSVHSCLLSVASRWFECRPKISIALRPKDQVERSAKPALRAEQ
jgi:hypothetical protein